MSEHAAIERSIERSYLRLRTLLNLASLSEAFPRQLAKMCGIDCGRLHAVLFGDGRDYARELGLVPLGLVEVVETKHGRLFKITRSGARKARKLAARQHRRDRFRAWNRAEREMKGLRGEPRAWPRPDEPVTQPVATPVERPVAASTMSFHWVIEG